MYIPFRSILFPVLFVVAIVGCAPVNNDSEIPERDSGITLDTLSTDTMLSPENPLNDSVSTSCKSSKDCAALGKVCDLSIATGQCVECVSIADCKNQKQRCIKHICTEVLSCKSDKDCARNNAVCDTKEGICADCLNDIDCSANQLCKEKQCVGKPKPCLSSKDCVDNNQVCDKIQGVCVNCLDDNDCAAEYYCSKNDCLPDVCIAGASKCEGASSVSVCKKNGSDFDITPCSTGTACEEGSCKAIVCKPNEKTCDGDAVKTCSASGIGYVSQQKCESGQVCREGKCIALVCTPGSKKCDGTNVSVCKSDGLGYENSLCSLDQHCEEGVCKKKICVANEISCEQNEIKVCNAIGTSFTVKQVCKQNQICIVEQGQPLCKDQICQPGSTACNPKNTAIIVCKLDGLSTTEQPCATGRVCEQAQCVPTICSPNALYCDKNDVRKCDAKGISSSVFMSCTSEQICDSGTCLKRQCNTGEQKCIDASTIATCTDPIKGYQNRSCPATTTCYNNQCQQQICKPGEKSCSGTKVMVCDTNGLGQSISQDCQSINQNCLQGTCVAQSLCDSARIRLNDDPLDIGNNALIAHYKFNGDLNDSSGNGFHGIEVGQSAQHANSCFDRGIHLDVNSYIELGNNSKLTVTTSQPLSVSFWVRFQNASDIGGMVLARYHISDVNQSNFFVVINATTRELRVSGNGTNVVFKSLPSSTTDWQHIVAVFENGSNKTLLYHNGTLFTSGTLNYNANASSLKTVIGNISVGGNSDHRFKGFLDNVQIFQRVLSASDVSALARTTCTPTTEVCDGKDNDCNGYIDENCLCDYLGKNTGVCKTAVRDTKGTCLSPTSYNATEICGDNLDNNCDGFIDEGCPCYYLGKTDGICGTAKRDAQGVCAKPTDYSPTEICDNKDNDCNGQVDEGNTNTGSICVYCGNSKVETGEQCDDGNNKDGDGCSSTCQFEYFKSCQERLQKVPTSLSGNYTIKPSSSSSFLNVYCDMTTLGGGWTLIFKATTDDNNSRTLDYTIQDKPLRQQAQEVLIAYLDASNQIVDATASFPIPQKWIDQAPMQYWQEDLPLTVKINGVSVGTKTLRFGYADFDSTSCTFWTNQTYSVGRIGICGTSAPYWTHFAISGNDNCSTSDAVNYTLLKCTTQRRFAIFVR